MIVLKATQEKVLSVLQSVAGIVERRHTLPIFASVVIGTSTSYDTNSRICTVGLYAPQQKVLAKLSMWERLDGSQRMLEEIERFYMRAWTSCWRLVCDRGTRRRGLNSR